MEEASDSPLDISVDAPAPAAAAVAIGEPPSSPPPTAPVSDTAAQLGPAPTATVTPPAVSEVLASVPAPSDLEEIVPLAPAVAPTAPAAPAAPVAVPVAAPAAPALVSADDQLALEQAVHDVVLRSSSPSMAAPSAGAPRAAGSSSLASTVEALGGATTIDELAALLGGDCMRAIGGAHSEAVVRCLAYVGGLAREEERVLCGWPILSINEWGSQQVRTLVLTSMALYRIAFSSERGAIDHYSRTSLGSLTRIERGRFALKLVLSEPDGRENPFTYFWSSYVKKATTDHRYEKVYYPIHTEDVPVELVLASIICAVDVANALLCERVRAFCYVTRVSVVDYRPNATQVDEWINKLEAGLEKVGDGVRKVTDQVGDKMNEGIRTMRSSRGSRR